MTVAKINLKNLRVSLFGTKYLLADTSLWRTNFSWLVLGSGSSCLGDGFTMIRQRNCH